MAAGNWKDITDFENLENMIKTIEPSFNDLTQRMHGKLSNFAQQELSAAIVPTQKAEEDIELKPFQLFLLTRGKT